MNDAVLAALRCPNCSLPLAQTRGALRCARGHSFDLAKQGYAALTAGRTPHTGDSTEMITDREAFLSAGHYAFIADALAGHATAGLIVDAGTGNGYYLAKVLDAEPEAFGLGLDVSKPALRRAARTHPRADAALADLWAPLPLADDSAALILNVFAPRNGPEFRRILRPGGALIVVTPLTDHLRELVEAADLIGVQPDKSDKVREALEGYFDADDSVTLRRELHLTAAEARTLVGMTPSARHPTRETADITVTAAVDVTVWR
jgi:23S rRNA (guanine745-N1)-methyltransferase